MRQQTQQNDGGADGRDGHNGFDGAGEPVVGVPQAPDLQNMGQAAGDDKNSEENQNPIERQVATPADKPQQGRENISTCVPLRGGDESTQLRGFRVTVNKSA